MNLFIIFDILHYIPNFTIEDFTEHLYGMRTNALIPFQSCNLSRADVVFLNQCILGNPTLFHYIP